MEGSLDEQSVVYGEKQWGENTALRDAGADGAGAGCVFPQLH